MKIPLPLIIIATLILATLMGVGPLGMVTVPPVYAQAATPQVRNTSGRQQQLNQLLLRMSRNAGVTIVADSTVGSLMVEMPTETTTPQNFETQIADIVKGLPTGTTWARLYLPEPKGRRPYSGDDVAAYALAQSKLFGPVGGDTPGAVEILGQKVPLDKAEAHIKGLNLQPVYLITNPNSRSQTGLMGNTPAEQWAQMTPEQRQQAAEAAGAQLASMNPEQRAQVMQQHFMVMSAMMRLLPPDQRQIRIALPGGGQGAATGEVRIIARPEGGNP